MTRMWGIDPRGLCDQHLVGEHAELHQLVGTIANHQYGEAIARGHAKKNQIDTRRIESRHEQLVVEFERRGLGHDSPLSYDDELNLGAIDTAANLDELAERCADCRRRIERIRDGRPIGWGADRGTASSYENNPSS